MVLAELSLAPNLVASIKAIIFDEGNYYFSNLNLGLCINNKPIRNNAIVVQTNAHKE